jgi:hypothetical protein
MAILTPAPFLRARRNSVWQCAIIAPPDLSYLLDQKNPIAALTIFDQIYY